MKDIKQCAREGCHRVAVGVSRWDPDRKPESRWCRPDYLAQAELVEAVVVGELEVTDAVTQVGVGKGGTVVLDPLQVNLLQLVYAGHIDPDSVREVDRKPKPTAKPAESKKD